MFQRCFGIECSQSAMFWPLMFAPNRSAGHTRWQRVTETPGSRCSLSLPPSRKAQILVVREASSVPKPTATRCVLHNTERGLWVKRGRAVNIEWISRGFSTVWPLQVGGGRHIPFDIVAPYGPDLPQPCG